MFSCISQPMWRLTGTLAPSHAPPSTRCRIERNNLFEQLCALLSKTAFPVSGPLAAVHLQSLDGILAILSALAASCSGVSDLGEPFLAGGMMDGSGGGAGLAAGVSVDSI